MRTKDPKYVRYCSVFSLSTILIVTFVFVPQTQSAVGGSSARDSGYNHGCNDVRLNPSDRYINQPGKGSRFHTPDFMRGYNAGFSACSGGGGGGASGSMGTGTFADGQRAGKSQGHADAINGRPADDRCGSGRSNDYCTGYKLAYNIEYNWTRWVQDRQ